MDKKDPTYIPTKQKGNQKRHREVPPNTRSARQSDRLEEDVVSILSESESVTLVQQTVLGERLKEANSRSSVIKTEKMDTDGAGITKLLEMMITRQTESEQRNRELIERISRDRPSVSHSVDRIDLTRDRVSNIPQDGS